AAEALALLFEGDGDHAGLDDLLKERKIGDARARIAAATALAEEDRARWSGVVQTLDLCLTGAESGLRASVGKRISVGDRRGRKWPGVVTDEGGGAFQIGPVEHVRSADLSVDTLLALLPAGALDERGRLVATFYFGDAKSRDALDPVLAVD